jgi:circadian clock protein KaiC
VVVLRNILDDEKRRRTMEILKFRGTDHQKGEYPFTIHPRDGIIVLPLSALELKQQSTDLRITSGNPVLDDMCGGGFFRDSIILVSGATGTGKTLMVTASSSAAASPSASAAWLFCLRGEPRSSSSATPAGWGLDFDAAREIGTASSRSSPAGIPRSCRPRGPPHVG